MYATNQKLNIKIADLPRVDRPREKLEKDVIVPHNHPSGDPEPSEEDLLITKRLTGAGNILGIELLDHIIIAHDSFLSFKEKNLL